MRAGGAICLLQAFAALYITVAHADERPVLPDGCEYTFAEDEALDLGEMNATSCDPAEPRFRLEDLEMTVGGSGDGEVVSLGSFSAYLEKLRDGAYACESDQYEYGIVIACTEPDAGGAQIVIEVDFEPTRYPELAHVGSIRVGQTALPEDRFEGFLEKMIRHR